MLPLAANACAAALIGLALLSQDAVLAYRLGLGPEQDAFQGGYQVVSMLWNILSGGTYLAVAMPLLVNAERQVGPEEALRTSNVFVRRLCLASLAFMSSVLFIAAISSWWLPRSAQLGPLAGHAAFVMATMSLTLPLHLLSTHVMCLFLKSRHFFLATASTAIIPLTVVAIGLATGLDAVAGARALLLGAILQFVLLGVIARAHGVTAFTFRAPDPRAASIPLRDTTRNFALVALAALLVAGVHWLVIYSGSRYGPGGIARISYALRPTFLISAFLTTVVANVLLQRFTRLAGTGQLRQLRADVIKVALIVAAAGLGIVIAWRFIDTLFYTLVFQHGQFAAENTAEVVRLNRIAMLQIPVYIVGVVAWRGLNAISKNTWVLASAVVTLVFVAGALTRPGVENEAQSLMIAAIGFAIWAGAMLVPLLIALAPTQSSKLDVKGG